MIYQFNVKTIEFKHILNDLAIGCTTKILNAKSQTISSIMPSTSAAIKNIPARIILCGQIKLRPAAILVALLIRLT